MTIVSPLASVASLVSLPILFFSTRYYLHYATPGYRRERMSYATMSGSVSETAEGARTVDAHRLGRRQGKRIEGNIRESFYSEMYTLLMRMVWFPTIESAFALAVATTLAWSGWLALHHDITIGAATTVTLYVVQINDPIDRIVSWLDELQVGQTSLARLVGVSVVRDDRPTEGLEPSNETITMNDVHYAYRPGLDVLNGLSLTIRPGERLAIVGPSGAGKSTIGRLLAGIDAPRSGSVMVGDVALAEHAAGQCLRRHVALVTQEHHIFIGTVRENLALAKPEASDDEIVRALDAVDALEWVRALPDGMLDRTRHDGLSSLPRAGPADRAGATRPERPAHPGARRGDRDVRPARGPSPRALPRARFCGAERSWRSRTACTRRTTPTGSASSSTARSPSSARTTSSSR